jgi:hypothetical protein
LAWVDEVPDLEAHLGEAFDYDCDSIYAVDDCDDEDPYSLTRFEDGDCDSVLTADDCDDSDPTTVTDMDCDGISVDEDCDDGDSSLGSYINDADCDGIPTAVDVDDEDPSVDLFGDLSFRLCTPAYAPTGTLYMACEVPPDSDVPYLSMEDSQSACLAAGFDGLAETISEEENTTLIALNALTGSTGFWVGLTRPSGGSGHPSYGGDSWAGDWEWLSGRPVVYTGHLDSGLTGGSGCGDHPGGGYEPCKVGGGTHWQSRWCEACIAESFNIGIACELRE